MERESAESKNYGVEQAVLELREYLKDASVGDPKFQAFFDHIHSYELSNKRIEAFNETENKHNTYQESLIRILEFKDAFLDHEIEQKKIIIPGYQKASDEIYDLYKNMAMRMSEEAVDKSPDNSKASDDYLRRKLRDTLGEITDYIWERS